MKGIKGFFVCGKDNFSRTRHSHEEMTAGINRLKEKHPSPLLTIEDLHSVMAMAASESEEDNEEDDNVMWNEDGDSEESEIALMDKTDLMEVEDETDR